MASLTDLLLQYGNGANSASAGAMASGYGNLDGWGGPTNQSAALNGVTAGLNNSNSGIMGGLSGLLGSAFGGVNDNGTTSLGWAAPTIGIAQAIMGGINGNRQLGLAEDNLKEGKRQFNLNYGAQRQTTNTQLEDRQRARVASNPGGGYESVDSYLEKNRIR